MFFKLNLRKLVAVQPVDLGPLISRRLDGYLRDAVEGKCLTDIGVVVAVLDIINPQELEGKVLDNGIVQFNLTYVALVCQLFEGEVLDVRVTDVKRDGFFATNGPFKFYVTMRSLLDDYVFEGDGALATFAMKDGSRFVRINEAVRIRIFSPIANNDGYVCGTMDGEFLGPR